MAAGEKASGIDESGINVDRVRISKSAIVAIVSILSSIGIGGASITYSAKMQNMQSDAIPVYLSTQDAQKLITLPEKVDTLSREQAVQASRVSAVEQATKEANKKLEDIRDTVVETKTQMGMVLQKLDKIDPVKEY